MTGTQKQVTAKARKRCPHCRKLIEAGEQAILTDDRYMTSKVQWFGREYQRGAWHIWHPDCWTEREQQRRHSQERQRVEDASRAERLQAIANIDRLGG